MLVKGFRFSWSFAIGWVMVFLIGSAFGSSTLSQPQLWARDQGKGLARLRAKRKEARESKQRHCKGASQKETRESHHILPGM